ncbi:protein transport protein Sec24-like At4g32640 [Hibiscus syriacus]|uniref:protein transport protein Sec24-like At4g32640 n=1 Tax=Hibiscus syriacus TaxID=106335 RepID=UPI001924DFE0|nr:protein transport protein Sec24-like At4g32640 [Hibiscus syriacus]XP_039056228.1 protein transport protein Sec24-like At4g32640 [Hibiscus syriacus]
MAAPMPPGAPRSGANARQQPPPPNFNPNHQTNPNSLADNVQNLNLNRPFTMPNSGPRPPPFGQQAPFPQSSVSAGFPVASRPGPPPGMVGRPAVVPPGPPQSTLPANVHPGRPVGSPVSHLPAFGARPPSASLPSSTGGAVLPSGAFPSSGVSSVSVAPPPAGSRPGSFVSSSPFTGGPAVPVSNVLSGPLSNGPPAVGSGALPGPPQFPSAASVSQPPVGPPPSMMSARPPAQASTMHSVWGSSAVSSPLTPPLPSASPFSAVPQARPPPPGSPYGPQTWPMQPQQGSQPPHIPGATHAQPPRMYGMPQLPNQAATTIPPAMGQPGAPMSGSSKIDPNQIPRPVPSATPIMYETRHGNSANPPPPATSDYIVRDTGNCSPRYVRCTLNQIPCTADLLTTSGMQLALLVQPMALPHPSEDPIQVVDFGESGPVRCSRCKGYINPFMKFIDQGRKFICNLCGFTDDTPRDYHCNLGPDGRRRDADERPELCKGTVEFVASKEYMVRDPMPAVYFFLIDVSMNAVQTGATAAACSAISQVITDLPEGPRTLVGIATFDSTIHFYNLKRALQQPLMLIVPDIQEVYTPLETDVIVQLSECRQHLELLLENFPTMFQTSTTAESCFGAAIKAAFLAMKSTGGKLLVFQSVLPSVGIGALSSREAEGRTNISASEKEAHKLLQPADKILKTMAIEFAEYQVCVDVFLTTQSYVDIASISVIPRTTGGQVYYYYPFSAVSDPAKLYNDLRWNITRPQGFEAVMRVRCSQGIQVHDYSGNFCRRIPTDIDLPGIDCDKCILVTLKHDDKLQDGSECAFQCALLYTTVYGQRRIRVTNLSLPCTNMLSNLFRAADLDAQFANFLKQAAIEIPTAPLKQVRDQVTNLCINTLLSYRKFCATVSSSGQLILPEALKLLPLYTLALIKSTGLRNDGRIDDRSFWFNYVSSLSTPLAVPLVYPRMFAIHNPISKEGDCSILPPTIPLSSEHVSDDGIYLLENGEDVLIYFGSSVDSNIVQQLFGFTSVDEGPTQFVMQQFDNPLSKKLNDVVNVIRQQRCSYLRFKLCKKGDPSGMLFLSCMVEDKNAGGPSYVEFLVFIHKQIQMKMS